MSGTDWDAEAGENPETGPLRADGERADRLKKSPSAFRTISEVADDLHIPQHVLRFWETRFPQVRPLKRGGGRRYYRPDDIALLRRISELLYIQGYTIKGVQRLLREGDGTLLDVPPPDPTDEEGDPGPGFDPDDEAAAAVVADAEVGAADEPAAAAGTGNAAADATDPARAGNAEAERLRGTLRDVLDELRRLRRQVPD